MSDDTWLSPKEVAQRLGVHRDTVTDWCQAGKIPYKRVGSRYWIPQSAVEYIARPRPFTPPEARDYLTVSQAAALLGINPDTVREWCRRGKLPFRKPGWMYYIPREAVEERMAIRSPSPDDYSPLDLRWIEDEYVREEVAAGTIPHPRLVTGPEEHFDWDAWRAGTLPLQVAEREWHARPAPSPAPPSGPLVSASLSQSRAALLDHIMTNAPAFMAELITLYGAFSNLQIYRRVIHDQQPAFIDLLVSFRDIQPATPFGAARREIGKRVFRLAGSAGYVRAPDLDRPASDPFDNPTTERFFRPRP